MRTPQYMRQLRLVGRIAPRAGSHVGPRLAATAGAGREVAKLPASIADVARLAKVSISTVSRVVNRSSLVNEKTRVRVESAIRKLGYRPNAFARGLMLRRSEMIGLVLPDLHGEFYSEIIRGANAQAREQGYNLVVAGAHDGSDSQSLLHAFGQRTLLDGLAVMVSEVNDGIAATLGESPVPFVLLDGDLETQPHDSVVIDQQGGAEELTRHLIESSCSKHLVFIGGQRTNVDTQARLAGCRAVLEERKLRLADDDVHFLDYEYESAFRLARAHVTDWAARQCAVFAANDEMAAGVLAAAVVEGVQLPQELCIVGFDDTRIARMTRPPLTTMRVPMSRMGAKAIELLINRIHDGRHAPVKVSLKPELVVRESCGASKPR